MRNRDLLHVTIIVDVPEVAHVIDQEVHVTTARRVVLIQEVDQHESGRDLDHVTNGWWLQ